jgi:hypothetical protein
MGPRRENTIMHQGSTHQEQLSIPTWETLHSWLRERMQELVQWADGVYVRARLEKEKAAVLVVIVG